MRRNPRPRRFKKYIKGSPEGSAFNYAVLEAIDAVEGAEPGTDEGGTSPLEIDKWFRKAWPQHWPQDPANSLFSRAILSVKRKKTVENTPPFGQNLGEHGRDLEGLSQDELIELRDRWQKESDRRLKALHEEVLRCAREIPRAKAVANPHAFSDRPGLPEFTQKSAIRVGHVGKKVWNSENIQDFLTDQAMLLRGARLVIDSIKALGSFLADSEKVRSIVEWGEKNGRITPRQADALRRTIPPSLFAAAANLKAGNTATLYAVSWEQGGERIGFLLEAGPVCELYWVEKGGVGFRMADPQVDGKHYYGDLHGNVPRYSDQRFFFEPTAPGSDLLVPRMMVSAGFKIIGWAPEVVCMPVGGSGA